jgi:cGMP-dependent protein kinase
MKFNEAISLFPNFEENINLLIEHVKFYSGIIFLIIDYLHSLKIIHRNIKINNFIIEKDGYLKLIDVGSAKKILNGYAKTLLGTPHYMAPEIVEGLNYTYPADYYSIGVCIYYLLYDKFPFGNEENDVYKIYQEILKKKNIFRGIENEIRNETKYINELISNLLMKEPNQRLSNFNKIKSSKFFTGFNWELLLSKKLKPPFMPKIDQKFDKESLLNNYGIHFENYIQNEKTISMERNTSQVKIENIISEGFSSDLYANIEILKEDEK